MIMPSSVNPPAYASPNQTTKPLTISLHLRCVGEMRGDHVPEMLPRYGGYISKPPPHRSSLRPVRQGSWAAENTPWKNPRRGAGPFFSLSVSHTRTHTLSLIAETAYRAPTPEKQLRRWWSWWCVHTAPHHATGGRSTHMGTRPDGTVLYKEEEGRKEASFALLRCRRPGCEIQNAQEGQTYLHHHHPSMTDSRCWRHHSSLLLFQVLAREPD